MSKRIHDLCSRIAVERDQKQFLSLVQELNRILADSGRDLENDAERKSD